MQNQYSLTLLASDTTIPAFDCGNADINDFLTDDALGFYLKCGFQCFTAVDETDDTRLMYFDLKPFKDALSQ